MRPLLDNLSLFYDIDAMGRPHRTQPMRDNKHRTPLADLCHVLLNHRFGFVVQRAGRLIEDQNTGIRDQGASNCSRERTSGRASIGS